MKGLQPLEEILGSWRRCMGLGVAISTTSIGTDIQEGSLQTVLNESNLLISLFDEVWEDLEGLIINNKLAFLLTNADGVLLKKIAAES